MRRLVVTTLAILALTAAGVALVFVGMVGGALYTSSAQPWAHIDPNKLRFEKMPPRAG